MTVTDISPDAPEPEDLELVDLDPQELIDNALGLMSDRFPDWQPREGNTEVVLIEALAREAVEMTYAINEVIPALTESFVMLFGQQRNVGSPPTGTARFYVVPSGLVTQTVPAGTQLIIDPDADDPEVLTTDTDLIIPVNATSGVVGVSGSDPDTTLNGTAAGTQLVLLDGLAFVNTVALETSLGGGLAPEDRTAFLARSTPVFSRLTSALVLPDDVAYYVLDQALAFRVLVLDRYNPLNPAKAPGQSPGYVTIAVAASGGGTYSADQLATITAQVSARMHAGLIVKAINATVTSQPVTVSVLAERGAIVADVQASVTAALQTFLDPDTWDWSNVVRLNDLIVTAAGAPGVDAVLAVTSPSSDRTLPGIAPLTTPGTIVVNVTVPT